MPICNCVLPNINPGACRYCPNNPTREFYKSPSWFPTEEVETRKGWVCPKCGRVYSNWVFECKKCNNKIGDVE